MEKVKEGIWFQNTQNPTSSSQSINRKSPTPVYAQLAKILRNQIALGDWPPGHRISAESALSKQYGVSLMTVRQAVGVLVEEGLVKRVHGSGTFVQNVAVSASQFDLNVLKNVLADHQNLKVKILKSTVERARDEEGKILNLELDEPVILIERLIYHWQEPFSFQRTYAVFDPEQPTVEGMLDTSVLNGLLFGDGPTSFKKGKLRLLPMLMDQNEAELLQSEKDPNAFKLEYVFYDFNDQPNAHGWFIVPHGKMPIISRVGVWND